MVRTKKKKITRKRIMMGGSGSGSESGVNRITKSFSLRPEIFFKPTGIPTSIKEENFPFFPGPGYNKYNVLPINKLMKEQNNMKNEFNQNICKRHYNINTKSLIPFNISGIEVYECNNQSIGIVYNREKYEFYTITPLMLSVSTMQIAAKTGSISIIEENGNYYIGFINDFPSLRIEEDFNYAYKTRPLENLDNKKTKISNKRNRNSRKSSSQHINQHINQSSTQSIHDTKQEAQWFNVYEDEDTLNDLNFQLIENYHACENKVEKYNSDIHQYLDNIIIPKYYKRDEKGHTIESIEPIYISKCTNLETYEYLTQKVRELIDIIKNKTAPQPEEQPQLQSDQTSNLTLKLKDLEIILHNFLSQKLSIAELNKLSIEQLLLIRKIAISKVIYRANIKFEDGTKEYITENIRWVCSNVLWVEKYLELKLKYNTQKNQKIDLLTDVNFSILQDPIYKCDLSGLQHDFFIVDEFVNSSEGDGQTYFIVGYPDKNMREHILNFWQLKTDNSNKELYDSFNGLDKDLSKKIADLYDSYKTDEKDKINYTEGNGINLYKLYMSLRKSIFEYVKNRYNDLNKEKEDKTKVSDKELQNFKDKFETNAEAYFQHIALKYLPKPMVFIKYVFLVFKKQQSDGKLIPMVFNVKEINPKHKPILKRVEKLIKHELPYRFGILSDVEYNNREENKTDPFDDGEGNEKDPFDDEYKLFYSRYRYGKFFHITTEYVHTMSNISDKAHGYKNSITLEELIYSSGLLSDSGKPFFEDVKLEYEVREHQINNYSISQYEQLNTKKYSQKLLNSGLRSEKVFDLYEKDKGNNTTTKNVNVPFQKNKIQDIKFILMFKILENKYIFIYLLNDKFYKLIIKYNIKQIVKEIIKKLKDKFTKNTISLNEPNKLIEIISNNLLSNEDYKIIFEQNPMIFKYHYKPNNDIKINTSYFYLTALLDIKHMKNYNELEMYNLYLDNPIIIINILDKFKKINEKNTNTKILNENKLLYDKNDEHYRSCIKQTCNFPINYIYYDTDYNKCGYDIIEIIDKNDDKITLWVNPSIITSKKLGNFMDLDKSSLLLLNKIKKLYVNNNYMCFVHNTSNIIFYCLHFHIIKKKNYDRDYMANNKGSFLIQDLYLENIINNITNYNNYYIESNFNIIKGY